MEQAIFNKHLPIAIGSDHAGFDAKCLLIPALEDAGWNIKDFGTDSHESTDYPDYAHPVAEAVVNGSAALGILICGTGNGVCMAANKHAGARAALCWNVEIATLARTHNDANILCLPARFVSADEVVAMTRAFLETAFEGGRHQRRVDKI